MNPTSKSAVPSFSYRQKLANSKTSSTFKGSYIGMLFGWFECKQSAFLLSSNLTNEEYPQVYAKCRTLQAAISIHDEDKMFVQTLTPFFDSIFNDVVLCLHLIDISYMITTSDTIDMNIAPYAIQDNDRNGYVQSGLALIGAQQEPPFTSIHLDSEKTGGSSTKGDNQHHDLDYYEGLPLITERPETMLFIDHSSRACNNLEPMASHSTDNHRQVAFVVEGKLEKANVSYC